MIFRLRHYPTDEELARMYAEPHDADLYGRGHGIRVAWTIAVAKAWQPNGYVSVVDFACGNAAIPRALAVGLPPVLGDFAPGYDYVGPIESSLNLWAGGSPAMNADLFVLSEALEHLDDPQGVLAAIRPHSRALLVTTPTMAPWGDSNPEHVWCWDQDGVTGLLTRAGWNVDLISSLDTRPFGDPYLYGLWIAS